MAVLSERRFTRDRLHERARQLFIKGGTGTLIPEAPDTCLCEGE
jgi:hypothetical protein